MIVDSSALFAIVFDENDHLLYLGLMLGAAELHISAPTLFECRLVSMRREGEDWEERLLQLLSVLKVQVLAFDAAQANLASDAYRRYGKGRDKASLNFGDCFSYALAKAREEPLLYKGGDFARTDMAAAV
jgi:ribonuclease VapC